MSEKAILYVRVSTQEQASEGVSLRAQEDRLVAYCYSHVQNRFFVLREGGVSASTDLHTRPGGSLIAEHVRKGTRHVVALKLDRLFRDAANALNQTREWDRSGVALHLVDMGGQTINTATAMGRFFLNMMAGFAELERNLIADRTRAALKNKKDHGEVYSATPYGFDAVEGMLVENAAEMAVVKQIHTWRAEGKSLRSIASHLNNTGVATKTGANWYASTVKNALDNDLYRQAA